MNILETIIARKKLEVTAAKKAVPVSELEKGYFFANETLSLKKFILDPAKTGIIAEYKRKSPSKGIINDKVSVEDVTMAYAKFGASGISVLTDSEFFGGSLKDLVIATVNEVPLLRKDFMIDEYQLYEAKAFGAEVILLIAACLSVNEVKTLAAKASDLGMEVLLEIHDESELGHICDEIDLVGVNNRNLKTFTVDLEQSIRLAEAIGDKKIKIAESGISGVKDVLYLKQYGFDGFLIGENFMKHADPTIAFADFVNELKQHNEN
jgi:indole-3-glycerol phosphate synthase